MNAPWHQADAPLPLLDQLDRAGQGRRLRLLACLFFRRIAAGTACRVLLLDATGWPDLVRHAETLADDPDDATARDALLRLRTGVAIDCLAMARLLTGQSTERSPLVGPGGPPVHLLPRLLLVALGSLLILPPSPLAATPLDREAFGPASHDLPPGHPRAVAERRIAAKLEPQPDAVQAIRHLLESLIASGVGLLLAADGSRGDEPNYVTILNDLRLDSPDEMALVAQGARDLGQPALHDLLRYWTGRMNDLVARLPVVTPAFIPAAGLAFLDAALATIADETPTLAAFQATERQQVETIRAFADDPDQPTRIDPDWVEADDRRVGRLAAGIYAERRWDELPILGDALEDAGCDDPALLDALHRTRVPFRGWWLLDALRGEA